MSTEVAAIAVLLGVTVFCAFRFGFSRSRLSWPRYLRDLNRNARDDAEFRNEALRAAGISLLDGADNG